LFHGPGAQEEALAHAESAGRLLAPPFGEFGLGVEETREAVALLGSAVIGGQVGVVVLGPMDAMKSENAADVLLKCLEEFDADTVLPILWATDAGNVRGTIRSRCLDIWCPYGAAPYTDLEELALGLCRAALGRDWGTVLGSLKVWEKSLDDKLKTLPDEGRGRFRYGERRRLLSACAEVLAEAAKRGTGWQPLWLSIRKTLRYQNHSKQELVAALLVGVR